MCGVNMGSGDTLSCTHVTLTAEREAEPNSGCQSRAKARRPFVNIHIHLKGSSRKPWKFVMQPGWLDLMPSD